MSKSIQYQLSDRDQLYFLHIQKTAGTTLYFTLDEKFDPEAICPARFWRQLLQITKQSPELFQHYRFFRGHFGYAIQQFVQRPLVHITVLRDPIERTVSHYEHIRREPKDRLHKLVAGQTMSFADFITHPETGAAIANLQTRSLAFDWGLADIRGSKKFASRGILGTPPTLPDDDLLAIAKHRLDDFAFVGLAERFQDSLLLLSYIFGWYPIVQSREMNKAPKKLRRSDLSPATLDAVMERNQLDQQIYQHGQAIFQRHLAQMLQELQDRYECSLGHDIKVLVAGTHALDLPLMIRLLEKHYERRSLDMPRHLLPSMDYVFNQAISGTGWHLREGAGSGWHLQEGLTTGGTPFRWTGPETVSTLDFLLSGSVDVVIRIRILNAAAPDILGSLTLEVNEYGVELEPIIKRGSLAVLQGVIPQAVLARTSVTRLCFRVGRTLELAPSTHDTRKVGLAFHRIQIFPVTAQQEAEEYTHYQFPVDDANWMDVAHFIRAHVQPDDKLVAPTEFVKQFPDRYRTHLLPFAQRPGLRWVVVHQGLLDEVDFPSLKWTLKTLRPVFSNSVFVVFSPRTDLPRIVSPSSLLLKLALKVWLLGLERHHLLSAQLSFRVVRSLKALYALTQLLRERSPQRSRNETPQRKSNSPELPKKRSPKA